MAPKKGSAAKKASQPLARPSESDHIVFTNKPDSGKGKNASVPEQAAPPKPDARKIIGGASWTGKLPVNLLSELCQREKWNKPEYSMRRVAGGAYRSSVTLSKTDAKTRETTALPPFELPSSCADLANQESALEARHFAATYTLFRVASMKNIHMTLPPTYRDLWKGAFQDLKKEDVKEKREWKYDADPFAAHAKSQDIKVAIEKRKVDQEKRTVAAEKAGFATPQLQAQSERLWSHATKIELGQNLRYEIEDLIRKQGSWTKAQTPINPELLSMELQKHGFRNSHIREAAEYCSTFQDAIEWLLIYVPEDDLPKWAFPPGYSAGISLASGNVAADAKLRRLMRSGYASSLCARALKENDGHEKAALEAMQTSLASSFRVSLRMTSDETPQVAWEDELSAIEAIYGERYVSETARSCSITLEPVENRNVIVHVEQPSAGYPNRSVPLLTVEAPSLPAYIRLSVTKKALNYAWTSLIGDQMIYSLIEHIQAILPDVMEDPGPLVDLELRVENLNLSSLESNTSHIDDISNAKFRPQRPSQRDPRNSREIKEAWEARHASSPQQNMMKVRAQLPAWKQKDAIIKAVEKHQVTLITGDTGSGKSTQSVQFILDEAISKAQGATVNILCTQPRRVAALALSDRVTEERCSAEGEEVGYIIRGSSKVSSRTKITFMTTGVLLRRLQLSNNPQEALNGITHVFIDEVHERSLDTDFLLALLKGALPAMPRLSLILMSATVDPETFIKYFNGTSKMTRVHVEGRTYPVRDYYLDDVLRFTGTRQRAGEDEEDAVNDADVGKAIQSLGMGINYDLITSLVEMIDVELGSDPGAVLVFLPGTLEIDRCLRAINRLQNMYALPLHASLMPVEQKKVFPAAPRGRRKVICSTNVAETSVTISDIVAVIDTGRVKETTYDISSNMVRLQEMWASQAACKQRRGRAGRVQAGSCYKLFTRNVESSMRPQSDPEVKRVPLEQLCLNVRSTTPNLDVATFLRSMMSPPADSAVASALRTLHRVGALDHDELTGLGSCMAMVPADLKCAKLIILGSLFSCLEACLTIAAILATKSPFVWPKDKRDEADEARRRFGRADGDLSLDRTAYDEWKETVAMLSFREARSWCEARFLSHQTLRDIDSTRQQLLESIKEADLIPNRYHPGDASLNANNDNAQILRALIAGSLNPNIAEIRLPEKKYMQSISGAKELDPEAKTIQYFDEAGRVFVHPSSVLFDAQTYSGAASHVSYFTKMATSKTFIRDLTPVNPYGILLLGGQIEIDTTGAGILVDGWIRMKGWARIGVLVSRLRKLLDTELTRRIDERDNGQLMDKKVVDIVRRLVELSGQDA